MRNMSTGPKAPGSVRGRHEVLTRAMGSGSPQGVLARSRPMARSRGLGPLAALLVGAIVLAGCGSGQTKTVSVSSASSPAAISTTAGAPSSATMRTTAAPHPSTTSSGATQAAGSAPRTASGPAFTQQGSGGQGGAGEEDLNAAVAVVKAHGFTPSTTSDYHAGQTLRVLIGTRSGSGDGHGQQAFFFVGGRYIGTDASEPSATVRVLSQSDTEVTLAYSLYRPNDPLCCPGGGQATVVFQLNNGQLAPLAPIPPVHSSSGLSRQ